MKFMEFHARKILFLVLFVFVSLSLIVCPALGTPRPRFADIERLPQDGASYLPSDPDAPIVDFARQMIYAEAYLERHFAPWQSEDLSFLGLTFESLAAFHNSTARRRWYSSDGRQIARSYIDAIVRNGAINRSAIPRRGVMIMPDDVRILPYGRPVYGSRGSALGLNGLLRLDILQLSTARPGEPLAMLQASADANWVFVATSTVAGWVRNSSVAVVDDEFVERFMSSEKVIVARDNAEVMGDGGRLLYRLKLGTVLPAEDGKVLLPVRGSRGFADVVMHEFDSGTAQPFPIKFTPRNAALAIDQMIGETYGWGGSSGFRDCSALTRDYFALFGIWLPRNSRAQARTGEQVSLGNLTTEERINVITNQGVPFATLIQMPGHIVLYVGTRNGEPLVFHNIWGVRTGGNGRAVIGRAVISTLKLGAEIPGRQEDSLMLDRLAVMSFPMAELRIDQY